MPLLSPRYRLSSLGDSIHASESSSMATCSSSGQYGLIINKDSAQGNSDQNYNQSTMNSIYINSYSKGNTLNIDTANSTNLLDYERSQIEYFFSGLDTEVFVCSSLANLYEGTEKELKRNWHLVFTGIPVILYDKGNIRSRSLPKLTLVLAERGSCFALWSDCINDSSNYQMAGSSFHTMRLSTNHQQTIGFSYDSSESAREFWQHMSRLIKEFKNKQILKSSHKKFKEKYGNTVTLPLKAEISNPCQFQHITNVTKEDNKHYYSMQLYGPKEER